MNRELKFRVWNPEQNKMEYFEMHNITVPERLLTQEKYPVQQFTGQIDKNGKEIYEGDLLAAGILFEVKHAGCDYVLYRVDNGAKWGRLSRLAELGWSCEVIGNIFENPELLKQE